MTGYDGTPKAGFYWLKRVTRPLAVLIQDNGPTIKGDTAEATIYVHNQGSRWLPQLKLEVKWLSVARTEHRSLFPTLRLDVEELQSIVSVRHALPEDGFILLHAKLLLKDRILAEVAHPYTNRDWSTIAKAMTPVKADTDRDGRTCTIKAVQRPLLCVEIPGDDGRTYPDNFFSLPEGEERVFERLRSAVESWA